MKGVQLDAFPELLLGRAPAPSAAPHAFATSDDVLAQLKTWSELGWLRRLDSAFAAFLCEISPPLAPVVVFAAAMVAHMEGRGHTCVPASALTPFDETSLPGWPAPALSALQELLVRLPHRLDDWLAALRDSAVVYAEGAGAVDRQQPLVLDEQARLYLRRHWRAERSIARQVLRRVESHRRVDPAVACDWLTRLFGAAQGEATGPDWQKLACGIALRSGLSIITGGPGTGKTYTAARLLALLYALHPTGRPPLRVALAAPTGKAAARLKQALDGALEELHPRVGAALPLRELSAAIGPARTLHSLLGARSGTRRFRHDAAHPLPFDVIIVDEASMIHLEMMASLLEASPPDARIVLLGDKDQLASVEAGAVLGDLCRHAQAGRYTEATRAYALAATGEAIPVQFLAAGPPLAQQTVMLRESRRFAGPIGRLALAVNQGAADAALLQLRQPDNEALRWISSATGLSLRSVVRLATAGREGAAGGYRHYIDAMHRRPLGSDSSSHLTWVHGVLTAFERFRVLCAGRAGDWGVAGLNEAIETALVNEGLLPRRDTEWYEGRPVMVTRNDPTAGVFNGDIGVALMPHKPGATLRVHFLEGAQVRSVAVSRLAHVETAFAMTVHKSQGSEFEHTVLVLHHDSAASLLTRELLYTGITRARRALTLVASESQTVVDALARTTQRASGLPHALNDVAPSSREMARIG